jgi:hypothetical protein
VQFSDVSVQLDVHNMVISEIDHLSVMIAAFTFPELAPVIDSEFYK